MDEVTHYMDALPQTVPSGQELLLDYHPAPLLADSRIQQVEGGREGRRDRKEQRISPSPWALAEHLDRSYRLLQGSSSGRLCPQHCSFVLVPLVLAWVTISHFASF